MARMMALIIVLSWLVAWQSFKKTFTKRVVTHLKKKQDEAHLNYVAAMARTAQEGGM